jgi:hypothetical protein
MKGGRATFLLHTIVIDKLAEEEARALIELLLRLKDGKGQPFSSWFKAKLTLV